MPRYHNVPANLHTSKRRRLSKEAKLVLYHVKTAPQRLTEGCFRLPLQYVAMEEGLTEPETLKAIAELEDQNFIEYDADSEVVLDLTALLHFSPKGWPQIQGAVNALLEVPDNSPLLARLYELAKRYAPDLAKAIRGEYVVDPTKTLTGDPRYPYADTPSIPSPYPIEGVSRAEQSRARAREELRGAESRRETQRHTGEPSCNCNACKARTARWKAAAGDVS